MTAQFLAGARNTLGLFALCWVLAFPPGLIAGVIVFRVRSAQGAWKFVAFVFGSTPILVALFWLHYPLQTYLDVIWPPVVTATGVIALYLSVSVGDVTVDALRRADSIYNESAKVLGLSSCIYIWRILAPNAWRTALPRLFMASLSTMQATMFASLIGVEDLFRVTQRLNAQYLQPVELFSIMGGIYIMLCAPLYLASLRLNSHSDQERDHA